MHGLISLQTSPSASPQTPWSLPARPLSHPFLQWRGFPTPSAFPMSGSIRHGADAWPIQTRPWALAPVIEPALPLATPDFPVEQLLSRFPTRTLPWLTARDSSAPAPLPA